MLLDMKELVSDEQLEEVKKSINTKADKLEINKLYEIKSNKIDIEGMMKVIQVINNQMEYMCMTDISILKSFVNLSDNKFDSKMSRENKQLKLLTQATSIYKWVS